MEKFDNVIQCCKSSNYINHTRGPVDTDNQIAKNVAPSVAQGKDLKDKRVASYDSEV